MPAGQGTHHGTRKQSGFLHRLLVWLVPGLLLAWTLFPIGWAFILSIKQPQDFFTAAWLPFFHFSPTLDHWRTEWHSFGDPAGMGRSLVGSILVAVTAGFLSTLIGGLAAYDLHLRRRNGAVAIIAFVLLLPRLVPPIIVAMPLMAVLAQIGLGDSYLALVIANTSLGLSLAALIIFLALAQLPEDILAAAHLDGCSGFAAFRHVVLPLLRPAVAASFLLCAAQSWNEFLNALFNVQHHAQVVTLAVAALLTKDGVEFETVGSHLVLVLFPPLLLILMAQLAAARRQF